MTTRCWVVVVANNNWRSRRFRATEQEAKTQEKATSGKYEKMEEILRKVDAEFLAMIKDAEEEETKGIEDDGRK